MSFFSDNTRVATTATPNFTVESYKEPNVGQYGWTKSDTGHYNQLIQYVDECRKIYESIKDVSKILEVAEGYYQEIKRIYDSFSVEYSAFQVGYSDFSTKYTDFSNKYRDFSNSYVDFRRDFTTFLETYPLVGENALAAAASATAAKGSEDQSKTYYEEVKAIYEDLKEGQVYRGTWNPNTGSYPDPEGTNSVWDVILNPGQTSTDYDGKTWYNGDRLVYIETTKAYEQIATGLSGVQSVNGKTGAVTLTYTDLGAAPDGFGLGVNQPNTVTDMDSDPNTWPGEGKVGWLRATSATANRPDNQAGVLMVTRYASGTGAIYVQFFGVNRKTYTRRWAGAAWQDWAVMYDTANKPTALDVGALSSSGGVVSGSVYIEGGSDLYMRSSSGSNTIIYFQDGTNSNRSMGEVYCDRNTGGMIVRSYGATTNEQAWLRIRHDETSPMYKNAAGTYAMYHAGNKPTASDVGALPSTGGTVNGDVVVNGGFKVIADGEGGQVTLEHTDGRKGFMDIYAPTNSFRIVNAMTSNTEVAELFPDGNFVVPRLRTRSNAEVNGQLEVKGEGWGVKATTLDGNGSQIAMSSHGKLDFTMWNASSDNSMRFGWRRADGTFDTRFAVLDDNFICNYNMKVAKNLNVDGTIGSVYDISSLANIYSNGGWVGCFPSGGARGAVRMELNDEPGGWHSRVNYTLRTGYVLTGVRQLADGNVDAYTISTYNGSQAGNWHFTPNGNMHLPGGGCVLHGDGNISSPIYSRGTLFEQVHGAPGYQDSLWKNRQGRTYGWTGIQSGNFEFVLDGSLYGVSIFASDRRLKTNIKETEGKALDVVKEIPFKTYDWDQKRCVEKAFDGHVDYGIIAQELEEISKGEQYVTKVGDVEENGTYQLNLMNLVTLSLKAIQELQQEVADLKAQLNQ